VWKKRVFKESLSSLYESTPDSNEAAAKWGEAIFISCGE
jgi:hypothetical protein